MRFKILIVALSFALLTGCIRIVIGGGGGGGSSSRPPSIDVSVGNCSNGSICNGWTKKDKQCTIVKNRFDELKSVKLIKVEYNRASPDQRTDASSPANEIITIDVKANSSVALPIIEPGTCPAPGNNLEYNCYYKGDDPRNEIDCWKRISGFNIDSKISTELDSVEVTDKEQLLLDNKNSMNTCKQICDSGSELCVDLPIAGGFLSSKIYKNNYSIMSEVTRDVDNLTVEKLQNAFNLPEQCSIASMETSAGLVKTKMSNCFWTTKIGSSTIHVEWPDDLEFRPTSEAGTILFDFVAGPNIILQNKEEVVNKALSGPLGQLLLEKDDVYASVAQYCYHSPVP